MATVTISIPDFQYTAHFYPEILEDLIQYMRNACPELTDEDPTEPHIQLVRAFALSYHLNACLLDLVANEMYLPTAKLRASHKNLLALIDYQLKQASPASAELVAQLSKTFAAPATIVIAKSVFSTAETRSAQSVEYECLENVSTIDRTDQMSAGYGADGGDTGPGLSDITAALNSAGGPGTSGGWGPSAGDALYIGHRGVMFDRLDVDIATPYTGGTPVWEYYDGNYDQDQPDLVVNLGAALEFTLTSLLGTTTKVGTVVRVRSAITGAFQDLVVVYSGGLNKITTTGVGAFLGQSSPSTNPTDYIVGSDWHELPNLVDTTNTLNVDGTVTWTLPKDVTHNWSKTTVGTGIFAVEAFWIRLRMIVAVGGEGTINRIQIDQGKQYLSFEVSQGRTQSDNPLGSSDGSPTQQFVLTQFPVIDDDTLMVTVDEGGGPIEWTRVDNFLNSVSTDRHYTLTFDDDGGGLITFGDGTNGKVPPAGVNNIVAVYRTMTEIDGNVGSQTITVNRNGIAYLANVTNPAAAFGYVAREGSDDEDLARLKIAGPASLRTLDRAVAPQDVEQVARDFTADDGSTPVSRALAIEESFGPKTVELVVVGAGGGLVDASKLQDIEDYFNGTEEEPGKLLLNQELTATNFTPRAINITVTLTDGTPLAVVTALKGLLNPLAKQEDGNWQWDFGGLVPLAKLYQIIMDTDSPPTNALITLPAADVTLATRELPQAGTITINGIAY